MRKALPAGGIAVLLAIGLSGAAPGGGAQAAPDRAGDRILVTGLTDGDVFLAAVDPATGVP